MTLSTFSKHVARTGLTLAMVGILSTPFVVFAQSKDVGNPSNDKGTAATPGTATAPAATPAAQPVVVAPAGTAGVPVTPGPAAQSGVSDSAFKPLTQLPGIQQAASSDTLPQFLNQVYKICIGLGAGLAVVMIMYAGFQIMTSQGSVSSNEKAKTRIREALFGLLLILAPTILFTIINPDILKLNLNVTGLESTNFDSNYSSAPGSFTGADTVLWEHVNGDPAVDAKACTTNNGTLSFGCKKKDGTSRNVSSTNQCTADEDKYDICKSNIAQANTANECLAQYTDITSFAINTNGNACNAAAGSIAVNHGCCTGQPATGFLCCAKPKDGSVVAKTNTVTIEFVGQVLTTCGVQATQAQKNCLYSGTLEAIAKKTLVDVRVCIPTINGTQNLCAQSKLASPLAQ
jgi:hypothetical protein